MSWLYFQDIWEADEKVSFNGDLREIRVNDGASRIDVKIDIYSAWKRWSKMDDHGKFLPALRTIGGDPLGGGLFAGDLYFLLNGWKVVVDTPTALTGVLYTEDGTLPYIVLPGGGVVATVSSLVQTAETIQTVTTVENVPTANEIATAVSTHPSTLTVQKFVVLK